MFGKKANDTMGDYVINEQEPTRGYPSANMDRYITKDSGERQEFSTGMKRDTETGKPRFDLVEPMSQPFEERMSTRLASLMGRGADKYGDRNWEQAETPEELLRYLSSAERHFRQWVQQVKAQAGLSYVTNEEAIMAEDHASATVFNITGAEYVKGRIIANGGMPQRILKVARDITPEELLDLRHAWVSANESEK